MKCGTKLIFQTASPQKHLFMKCGTKLIFQTASPKKTVDEMWNRTDIPNRLPSKKTVYEMLKKKLIFQTASPKKLFMKCGPKLIFQTASLKKKTVDEMWNRTDIPNLKKAWINSSQIHH